MVATIQILVLLPAVAAAVALVSARLKLPPAILLVLVGVALALVRGLPALELVLLLVLPTREDCSGTRAWFGKLRGAYMGRATVFSVVLD
jgi:monovalent cation/hydrogen antiporter